MIKRKEIYLAGGCFWGVEGYFKQIRGVLETEVGYANGASNKTSYKDLAFSGHAETLRLVYDANRIHLAELLAHYFRIIDPTSLNQQGGDRGTQYRTGIYYLEALQEAVARSALAHEASKHEKPIVVELQALRNFVVAESDHQDYLGKNPTGYCHVNLSRVNEPLYPDYTRADPEELKERLSILEFNVTQKSATEKPGSSSLDKFEEEGIYVDITNGQPLFSSADKYDAGCGWPSFTMPITTEALIYLDDESYGYQRIEVRSQIGNSHLGHVFEDGPKNSGGLRYCINGASLRFIPKENMEEKGYSAYLPYIVCSR